MRFKTVAEAFNHYRNATIDEIETRATQLKGTVSTDPNADITAINIEIEGLRQAKENLQDKQDDKQDIDKRSLFNPITGMNFRQPTIPQGDVFASAEYRSAFFKTLLGQRLEDQEAQVYKRAMDIAIVERRADAFDTTSTAAAVLPTITLNEIVKKAGEMGGVIHAARSFNVPANLRVPIGTPAERAARHVEGAAVESEAVNPTGVTFRPLELMKVLSMSASVRRMSVDAFEAYLIEELNNSILEAIAFELVKGDGDGEGYGVDSITWEANKNLVEYTGEPAYTDFAAMLGLLKKGYNRDAAWAMNTATLYNDVYTLTDLNERPLFVPDPRNDEVGHILGRPVLLDDYVADGEVLLGNFNYAGWNLADGIMIEVSRESSFRQGLVDFRALAIADTQVLVDEAFVKLAQS